MPLEEFQIRNLNLPAGHQNGLSEKKLLPKTGLYLWNVKFKKMRKIFLQQSKQRISRRMEGVFVILYIEFCLLYSIRGLQFTHSREYNPFWHFIVQLFLCFLLLLMMSMQFGVVQRRRRMATKNNFPLENSYPAAGNLSVCRHFSLTNL